MSINLDLIWHIGWTFHGEQNPRSGWSGIMQDAVKTDDPFCRSSDIRMLPIIDLNPNDMSCIYSVLVFMQEQAVQLNIAVTCITFDQPLFLKAIEIILSAKLNVVCRLDGFHTLIGCCGRFCRGASLYCHQSQLF